MHLREAKEAEEVEAVRRACVHIEAVYDEVWDQLTPGMTEAEINARAQFSLMRRGATHAGPHILFGAHAATRTARPGERVLEVGDVIVADIAAQFDGYWGDLTRCAHAGSPSDWARRGLGGRPRGLRGGGRDDASREHAPAASTRRSATSSRPTRSSAPACTARATRSAPRSMSRRSSSPARTSRCARA